MNNKKNGIPKLRFPGFTGAWEQRKLGEITSVITKGTTPLDKSGKGSINFVKVEDLSPDNSGINVHSMISKEEHEGRLKRSILKENDILFSIAGTLGRIGIVKSEILPANTNQALAIVRLKEGNLSYISTVLEGRTVREYIRQNPTVGAQPNLSLKQVSELRISFPTLQEQEQVGNFFNKLNSFIALHQRKLEHLQEQKKGLLQKMFPKNGETVPEVRFPGFTDAWEQRKLGEVATFINGRAYKQNELLDSGKYKVLRVGNFYTNDSWYYSNLELADKYYIDEGDLVYTWSATFGPHIWNGEKVIYHYHIWKIELSKFLDRDFTLQILEADKAKLLANTNGSTMIHVTKKDMESKVISLPNIEEQKKIGSYLMKFDSLITLHQRKLDHLELMKKGLLQQMFV